MNTKLTWGQITVLTLACLPMVAVGGFGAWGTYSNIVAEFHRAATAIGVVASGEGVVLILALVMVGLTMLGQAAPAPVRIGLWLAPIAAAVTGMVVADDLTERVVYAITPLAMSAAAEGLGLIARRIVVYRTGVDMEVQRRNAETVQRLAYHQARAANHPDERPRKRSERAAWRLAARVGEGDTELGAGLVEVQRGRLVQSADAALAGMLTGKPTDEPKAPAKDRTATAVLRERFAEMDPADAVQIAHDAHPDMPPAELAALMIGYGVIVDAVQVALILGRRLPEVTLDRGDAADAPQVPALPAVTLAAAIVEAASTLGPDAKARDIADHLAETRRLVVDEPYIRTALSRQAKRQQGTSGGDQMRGGYA
ncbi:conjugal transfer protein [Streptomyces sp. NPDC008141]|uniref:conjugal transfer protein n=1 Tax=Streptomyces sp. NPDC008141 TaxID=3364815 RepID=UPI0036E1D31C